MSDLQFINRMLVNVKLLDAGAARDYVSYMTLTRRSDDILTVTGAADCDSNSSPTDMLPQLVS